VAEPILFDARIEELLREIAADPASSLLRVPRPARIGVLLERAPLVGVATAGLTLAEQELVRVHRGEVAYLLRKLAVVRLFESPKAAVSRTRTNFASQPALEVSRGKWLERAEVFAAERLGESAELSSPEELLLECLRTPDAIESVPVTAIAAAANELEPTDQARIYAAQWLGSEDEDVEGARRILLAVLDAGASPANAAMAAANVAKHESRSGASRSSTEWYRRSARLCRSNAVGAFGWLTASFDCADTREADLAARFVNSEFRADEPATQEFVALIRLQVRTGELSPLPASSQTARRIHEAFEGPVRVIAHAYLNQ
jgi:hypothetical protein